MSIDCETTANHNASHRQNPAVVIAESTKSSIIHSIIHNIIHNIMQTDVVPTDVVTYIMM